MKSRTRALCFWAALFCLLCALCPVFYGVLNIGVYLLFAAAALLGVWWRFWEQIACHRHLRRLFRGGSLIGLAFFTLMSCLMIRQAYFRRPPATGPVTVIVLGGKVIEDQPSTVLRNRLNKAAAYLLSNPEATCVVSGGQGADEIYPEAVVMAAYLEGKGVAGSRILIEASSTNTKENLRFSAALIEDPSLPSAIVTDGFHQLRASVFAKAEGLTPYGLSSFTPPGLLPCYWVRDMFGVVVAWLQTR